MSTPNTSKVKWVAPTDLYENDGNYVSRIPVIPLADLTALVEGLTRQYRGEACFIYKQAFDDLLTQLEAHRKEAGS